MALPHLSAPIPFLGGVHGPPCTFILSGQQGKIHKILQNSSFLVKFRGNAVCYARKKKKSTPFGVASLFFCLLTARCNPNPETGRSDHPHRRKPKTPTSLSHTSFPCFRGSVYHALQSLASGFSSNYMKLLLTFCVICGFSERFRQASARRHCRRTGGLL